MRFSQEITCTVNHAAWKMLLRLIPANDSKSQNLTSTISSIVYLTNTAKNSSGLAL